MTTTWHRLVFGLLIGTVTILPAVGQEPEVPPFKRNDVPGVPPAVPGYEDRMPGKGIIPGGGQTPEGEVQGRGPIHEGFAQPGGLPPRPGSIIPKQPPDPIQETPPEYKPQGDNVIWIPGYWTWDDERRDFLWVSGFWRVPPAGRKWAPGYWTQTEGGWRWVTGFWAPAAAETLPYRELPPESLDRGPSFPAPGEDYSYVPGNWIFRDDRWLWQPGYWGQLRSGYVFVPPSWRWTPSGAVYVSGYWDYNLGARGVLFAPMYFSPSVYSRPGWSYRPSYALGLNAVLGSLWVRPNRGYYAFGDYYGAGYSRLGYSSWASYGPRSRDPLYGYYRWANRGNPNWQSSLVSTYNGRVGGTLAVPPRTLAAQQRLIARDASLPASLRMVQPLSSYRTSSVALTRVTATERVQRERVVSAYRQASVHRSRQEVRVGTPGARPGSLSLRSVPAIHGGAIRSEGIVPPGGGVRTIRPDGVRTLPRAPLPGGSTLPRTITPGGSTLPRVVPPSGVPRSVVPRTTITPRTAPAPIYRAPPSRSFAVPRSGGFSPGRHAAKPHGHRH